MPAVTKTATEKAMYTMLPHSLRQPDLQGCLMKPQMKCLYRVIAEETGLEITCRESENTRFYFVMNFTDEKQTLPASLTGMVDDHRRSS